MRGFTVLFFPSNAQQILNIDFILALVFLLKLLRYKVWTKIYIFKINNPRMFIIFHGFFQVYVHPLQLHETIIWSRG